jgi:hypothetical protein
MVVLPGEIIERLMLPLLLPERRWLGNGVRPIAPAARLCGVARRFRDR